LATKVVYRGSKRTIELLCDDDGSCPVEEFIDSLMASDRTKVDSLFALMGEKGQITNDQKFKKLEGSDGVFEFKSFQIRLLCFYAPGGRVVVCRGLVKKRDRHDTGDIRFVEGRRREFLGD
jgi:hypothetical protein